jgi:hypothetical protein
MKYTDSYGNVCTRYVERPDAISKFFATKRVRASFCRANYAAWATLPLKYRNVNFLGHF